MYISPYGKAAKNKFGSCPFQHPAKCQKYTSGHINSPLVTKPGRCGTSQRRVSLKTRDERKELLLQIKRQKSIGERNRRVLVIISVIKTKFPSGNKGDDRRGVRVRTSVPPKPVSKTRFNLLVQAVECPLMLLLEVSKTSVL